MIYKRVFFQMKSRTIILIIIIVLAAFPFISCDLFSSTEPMGKVILSLSPEGEYYNTIQEISFTSNPRYANIYYTLDGTHPDENSLLYNIYDNPIIIKETTTINAIAMYRGYETSDVVSKTFKMDVNQVTTPVFSIDSGIYYQKATVEINCPNEDAILYYSLDGINYNSSFSNSYSKEFSFSDSPVEIHVYASNNLLLPSEIISKTYEIKVAAPSFEVASGDYENPYKIKIKSITPSKIYYTKDGSDPDISSKKYYYDVRIEHDSFVRAIAVVWENGEYFYSDISESSYTVQNSYEMVFSEPNEIINIQHLTSFEDDIIFTGKSDLTGNELFLFKDNVVTLIKDINPGENDSNAKNFFLYKNILYFTANDGVSGQELWKYDGQDATLVSDISQTSGSSPHSFTENNNELYFIADNQLHKYDGERTTVLTTNPSQLLIPAVESNLLFRSPDL